MELSFQLYTDNRSAISAYSRLRSQEIEHVFLKIVLLFIIDQTTVAG